MKKYGKILVLFMALLTLLAVAGCGQKTVDGVVYTQGENGKLLFEQGNDVWSWEENGKARTVALNDELVLRLDRSGAYMLTADGRELAVTLDKEGAPVSVTLPWGALISEEEYALITQALEYDRLGRLASGDTPWVAIVVMLLLIAGGVLIEVYSKKLVNLESFSPESEGKKKLLTLRLIAGVVIALALIVLLILIFA